MRLLKLNAQVKSIQLRIRCWDWLNSNQQLGLSRQFWAARANYLAFTTTTPSYARLLQDIDMAAVKHLVSITETETDSDQAIKSKPNLSALHDKLDILWTSYLEHLDLYNSAHSLLRKHMQAGFLSLARADFEARTGVRKHGKDYYHERAVATKRIAISPPDGQAAPTLSVVGWRSLSVEDYEDGELLVEVDKTGENEEDVTQIPSPPRTPEPIEEDARTKDNDKADGEQTEADQMARKSVAQLPLEGDPLRWFGILVPGSLRSAQASFLAAVDDAGAESVTAAKAMRNVEVEIRRLRKEIRRAEKEDSTA